MITVAFTVPVVFERSVIRGHPPIETSPRPSATGSLHSAVGVLLNAGVVVVLLVVGTFEVVLVAGEVDVLLVFGAVEVVLVAGEVDVLLVAGEVVTEPAPDPVLGVLFAHTNLVPVFLHIYVTPLVFCV